ncbi:phospholipid-binding protein MlaC [Pseudoruegeria sp. SK021]|uniref:MlaC/ttg2D family ABC transporter substrate-binding protein n=1 Tax=Pseudoruegeria sp. SK021 TaxID=1933035 RepID=UPI001F0AC41D|nr:ABC transporter substrate-binding protein [Pseudoruegeria sp. SK021]
MNDTQLSRRSILAGLTTLTLLPSAAMALSDSQAEALVTSLVQDITTTINSGKSTTALYAEFEKIFEKYADVPTIARFSLGAAARSASAADLKAYTNAYAGYIARKYGRRFQEFVGGKIIVKGAKTQKSLVVVAATADLRGQAPFAVNFQVSDRSGRAAFINVVIEGVDMLITERTEIGALLDSVGGSIPQLTAKLKTL